MYFEGVCFLREFPVRIKELVTTVDNSLAIPAPLWEMVSSNVGTDKAHDGYVFHSDGTDGKSNIVWGVKAEQNGFYSSYSDWRHGYTLFAANSYSPGDPGVNGTFSNYITHAMPIWYSRDQTDYTPDSLPLRYWISVKKDRVILAYRPEVRSTDTRINYHYIGQPARLFDTRDHVTTLGTAFMTATSDLITGPLANNVIWVSRDRAFSENAAHHTLAWMNPVVNRVFGGRIMPSKPLLRDGVHLRGIMDYYLLPQDGRFRQVDRVTISGVDHVALEINYIQTMEQYQSGQGTSTVYGPTSYYNQLAPEASKLMFLIPKD